jgi:glycosyltransferase involved in cell wall biosynthesis
MRISLVSGVCLPPDAISYSVVRKLDAVRLIWPEADARIYCSTAREPKRTEIRLVESLAELICDPFFMKSDLALFEFGIFYELFDAVWCLPRASVRIATYHNITPPHLVPEADRPIIRKSLRQKINLRDCDGILCDSEFNCDDLRDFGIHESRLAVLHLPVPEGFRRITAAEKRRGEQLRILYVGRFVESKGVADLLEALKRVPADLRSSVSVTLAGDATFSDPDYVELLDRLSRELSADGIGVFSRPSISQHELVNLYATADLFVIPSYHEGYCIPVMEALKSGCFVIAYDNSNLPNVTGGLARLTPTGDTAALAAAITGFVEFLKGMRGPLAPIDKPMTLSRYDTEVSAHILKASSAAFRTRLREMLWRWCAGSGQAREAWRRLEGRSEDQ